MQKMIQYDITVGLTVPNPLRDHALEGAKLAHKVAQLSNTLSAYGKRAARDVIDHIGSTHGYETDEDYGNCAEVHEYLRQLGPVIELSKRRSLHGICDLAALYFPFGCTVTEARGIWSHADGSPIQEPSVNVSAVREASEFQAGALRLAERLRTAFSQEAVLVREAEVKVCFI
jgi:hypothetical protein